ncbi:hypothetical protein E5D98_01460 [Helicobacter pylori]|nr:hypothetical protein E5D98_01460 [Helicobacter pylori]
MGSFFKKSSNDTQEDSKDPQKKEEALKAQEENAKLKEDNAELTDKNQKLTTENEKLTKANADLKTDKDNLIKENTDLKTDKENLTKEKAELTDKNQNLTKDKDNLNNQLNTSQKQVNALEQSQQVLKNENAELLKEKENLTTDLSNAKNQADQEKDKLEQKHAPYKKLERLYEVFLEVKGCLNFNFVEKTHSAMDLIASVLSDSKYYLESLYNKASQELSDRKSDKGEKLAELFDLLFEYVKDNKFERLKEPSAYDSTCKKLYPEQNTSQKMRRVVLIGYTYDKKTTYYTIVDMGS